jgi:hypothetical protein
MIALELHKELASLVAVSGAILLTGLMLRNPLGPQRLQTDFAAQAASLILTAALLVVVTVAHQGFVTAGLNPIAAAAAVVGIITVSLVLFWKAFHLGERLNRADSGRSRSNACALLPRPGRIRPASRPIQRRTDCPIDNATTPGEDPCWPWQD